MTYKKLEQSLKNSIGKIKKKHYKNYFILCLQQKLL